MSDDSHKITPGGTLNITLCRKKKPAPRPARRAGQGAQPARGIVPVDEVPSRYIRRPAKGITFYDLAARVDAQGVYHHLTFPPFNYIEGVENPEVNARLAASYHGGLLSGDPFGHTLDGESSYENCLRLPLHSEYLYLDAIFRRDGEADRRQVIGAKDKRGFVKDFPDATHPAPQPEPTQPASDGEQKWLWQGEGVLQFTRAGEWQIGVESAWFYNPFETGSDRFKVTATGDPTAEAVEFSFAARDELRIYLTPRVVLGAYGDAGPGSTVTIRLSRLLPVLPVAPPVAPCQSLSEQLDILAYGILTPEARARFIDYYSAEQPAFTETFSVQDITTPGLVAVIVVQRDEKFYVWDTLPGSTPLAWSQAAIQTTV